MKKAFVIFFLFHGLLKGSAWDSVLPLARDVVNPKMDIKIRLARTEQVLNRLTLMDPDCPVVFVNGRATETGDGKSWEKPFRTIQEGIESLSSGGGWIWVAQGVYSENIRLTRGLCLFGGFGGYESDVLDRDPAVFKTVIRGDSIHPVVFMEHKTMIDGFTITRGGGGIWSGGGGILTGNYLAVIRNNVLYGNRVLWSGGGIFVYDGGWESDKPNWNVDGFAPIIEGNVIFHNVARDGNVDKCGDGLCIRHSTAMVVNNTIANHPHRGVEVVCRPGTEPTFVNCILWNNADDLYNHVTSTSRPVFTYNCIQDIEEGDGSLFSDPVFTDSARYDFSLSPASPCIDRGYPGFLLDLDSTQADIGALAHYQHHAVNGVAAAFASEGRDSVRIQVDDKTYWTPFTLSLVPGSKHRLSAIQAQQWGPYYQFLFRSWNPSGERVQRFRIGANSVSMLLKGQTRYYVTVRGDGFGPTPSGEGWYDDGRTVNLTADSLIEQGPGMRGCFSDWTTTGDMGVSSDLTRITVVVKGPVFEYAHWVTQYLLDAGTEPVDWTGLSVQIQPNALWHTNGDTVSLEAQWDGSDVHFTGWTGDVSDSQNPIQIVMTRPYRIRAFFEKTVPPNRPPDPFRLVSPKTDSVFQNLSDTIRFVWQSAIDPDSLDRIVYQLFLSRTERFAEDAFYTIETGEDTTAVYSQWPGFGPYYWRIIARDDFGNATPSTGMFVLGKMAGLSSDPFEGSTAPGLDGIFPNPFNGETTVTYRLSTPGFVSIQVLDLSGRIVRTLIEGNAGRGEYRLRWDGSNDAGNRLPSGLYLIRRILSGKTVVQKTMMVH